jgi:glucosamine--fructose-6-phosphate aminotransferase (isomerizing)
MCGILGYFGNNNALEILEEGLKKLTYRGYDSWGIGFKNNGKIKIIKDVGDFEKVNLENNINSNIGISHTRWATTGKVAKENAHPHADCKNKIAVVHNGIIENFQELKNELIDKGHMFKSETDTEIICHLIEEYMKKYEFPEAVRQAFLKLRGRNAIVVMHENFNGLVGAKNGSPLIVGIGKEEYFIASDVKAFLNKTKNVIYLDDNNLVILR